jgi:hypothetical protein
LRCKTATFASQNSNFHRTKQPLLQRNSVGFTRPLTVSKLQGQNKKEAIVKYIYKKNKYLSSSMGVFKNLEGNFNNL